MRTAPLLPKITITREQLARLLDAAGGRDRVENIYPASPVQRGMIFHNRIDPAQAIYVASMAWRCVGPFDKSAFEAAWHRLVARHDIFRTAFLGDDLERPLQVVLREARVPIAYHDFGGMIHADQDHQLSVLQAECRTRPFNFARPPLMTVDVVRFGDEDHRIIWTIHHALLDGWSVPLVLNELADSWLRHGDGSPEAIMPAPSFCDYIAWIETQDQQAAEAFWRDRLNGLEPQVGKLLAGLPGTPSASRAGERFATGYLDFDLGIDPATIERFAKTYRITQSTLAVAAWSLVIGRHSGLPDACFGLVLSGRPADLPQVESRIGMFISTLPLRIDLDSTRSVGQFLEQVQQRQIELVDFQYSSPVDVKLWSGVPADLALFDTIMVFDNYPRDIFERAEMHADGPKLEKINSFERTNYPLEIAIRTRHGLAPSFTYDPAVYTSADVGLLAKRFADILRKLLANPAAQVGTIDWLDNAAKSDLLVDRDELPLQLEPGVLVSDLVQAAVAANPSFVAVRAPNGDLTYDELARRSTAMAAAMVRHGVARGSRVALLLGISAEHIVAMLAAWHLGAAVVPIEPGGPPDRREAMLREAAPKLVVVRDQGSRILCDALPTDLALVTLAELDCTDHAVGPALVCGFDPAYVLFTSGTSGRPKGVVVSHGALANFIAAMEQCLALPAPPRSAWITPTTFDISLLEMLWPLASGGSVQVFTGGVIDDAGKLAAAVAAAEVDLVQATPSGWEVLLAAGLELGKLTVLCGGEAVPENLARTLAAKSRQAWHVYGPTETTIWSSAHRIVQANQLSIGQPLANTDLLVFDSRDCLADVGVAGELLIGGAGLAQGYLDRPARTAAAFVPHPFREASRLYRTGDRAVRLPGGGIRYLGRADGQLKLRGHRVESGEIEAALILAGAQQAKVMVSQSAPLAGELVAWVTPGMLDGEKLRQALQSVLPSGLIPAVIVPVSSMPLNANGKLDTRALPLPELQNGPQDEQPVTALQRIIASVWQSVLGCAAIGLRSSFFALGGHSLQATRIAAHLSEVLAAPVEIRAILENPTVLALAEFLEAKGVKVQAPDGPDQRDDPALAPRLADAAVPFESLAARLSTQAQDSPRRAAIVSDAGKLTFAELEQRSNQLAHLLASAGAGPETVVGLQIERSIEMLVAMVAIIKSGAAFLPIDPTYPAERQAYLAQDAKVQLIVTREILLDPALAAMPADLPKCAIHPDMMAYVIYTSGSTGRPKGAIVTQRNAANLYRWYANRYGIEEGRRLLVVTSYSFDLTLKNLLTPLLYGGTVVLAPPGIADGRALHDLIERHRVELVNCTPSQFYPMLEAQGALPAGLEFAILGGEPIRNSMLPPRGPSNASCTYINSYGPTECADVAIDGVIERPGDGDYLIGLGQPIDGLQAMVLDPQMEPVAAEREGELYLSGLGVGRGYLGRPGLTAERFLPDPANPGKRLYRTGDLARRGPDSTLFFAGRTDHQVKVRGHRIELGEIEAALEGVAGIRRAVAVTDGISLGAYYLAPTEIEPDEIERHLAAILPEFMIPAVIVRRDTLPMTPSGKLDRAALSMPVASRAPGAGRKLDPIETAVAAAYAAQLGIEDIRADDNFFKLGGHSLLAMRVVAMLRDRLKIEIPLQHVFDTPSVEGLAAALKRVGAVCSEQQQATAPTIAAEAPANEPQSPAPLSFAQERMLFLEQYGTGGSAYNVPIVARLHGALDAAKLAEALDELIDRHETLRTCFLAIDTGAIQQVGDPWAAGLRPESIESANLSDAIAEMLATRFDLACGRPLAARLLRLSADDHVLVIVIHHIATDAWSNDLLITDLGQLYAARCNPALGVPARPAGRYADWAVKQRTALTPTRLDELYGWWRGQLQGAPRQIAFPLDHPRPATPSYRGDRAPIHLSSMVTARIEQLARVAGATPFMAFLALFAMQLAKWTGDRDLVIGTPIANRETRDFHGVAGLFLNTLAIRVRAAETDAFLAMLTKVRRAALEAYSHQELPFEKLVEFLRPERDPSIHPVFQTLFVLQHEGGGDAIAADRAITIEPVKLPCTTAKFDLSLLLTISGEGVHGAIEYATDLFGQATMAEFADGFVMLAESVAGADTVGKIVKAARPAERVHSDFLVHLSAGDAGPPIFCIPPAAGSPAIYVALAGQLDPAPPLFGFDTQALADRNEPIPVTIEGFAELFLPALLRIQPEGPVRLLGYSVGGAIAFEMARKLLAMGREVESLILIDSYIHDESVLTGAELERVAMEVCAAVYLRGHPATTHFLDRLASPAHDGSSAQAMQAALHDAGVRSASIADIERAFDSTRALVQAARSWVPEPYPGSVTLLMAAEKRPKPINLCLDQWRSVANQVEVHSFQTSHIHMMDEQFLPQIAEIIIATLQQSCEASSGHDVVDEMCIKDA